MPQLDIQYSGDLDFDAKDVLTSVEALVKDRDSGTGDVKGRAVKAMDFYHSGILLTLSLAKRPHRDEAFMTALAADLADLVKSKVTQSCNVSISVQFLPAVHVSQAHNP